MTPSWRHTRWGRLALGVVAGAVAGLVMFLGSRLQGVSLYVIVGAAAGLVAGMAVHIYAGAVRLSAVTLTVPQVSQLSFVVTRDSQQVAWKLFVETATRISTQPLDRHAGKLSEAIASLYNVFQATRELLKTVEPSPPGRGPAVEQLAIAMLNLELRPFLARWHAELDQWRGANPNAEEVVWPEDAACREQLAVLQGNLRAYALGYAKLAGVPDVIANRIMDGVGD